MVADVAESHPTASNIAIDLALYPSTPLRTAQSDALSFKEIGLMLSTQLFDEPYPALPFTHSSISIARYRKVGQCPRPARDASAGT